MSDLLVKLEIYEGPLDLLLHLIKKNEVDIHDIPVALITSQYLEYLDLMEALNIEVAGEFLLMAATLTQIKSRLLLPNLNEDGEEGLESGEDPRMALVRPLLEHIKFKSAAEALEVRPILDRDVFARGFKLELEPPPEPRPDEPPDNLIEASLFDLVEAFRRLAQKNVEPKTMRFVVEPKTISQRIDEVKDFLKKNKSVSFEDLCRDERSRSEFILSFLAVLELARTGFLRFYQNIIEAGQLLLYLANPEADTSDLAELTY